MTGLVVALALITGILWVMAIRLKRLNRLNRQATMILTQVIDLKGDHAKCMGMVAAFVGDEWAASVLDAAAEHYASIEGQVEIKRLVQERRWETNIPAAWMRQRAEAMRAKRILHSDA